MRISFLRKYEPTSFRTRMINGISKKDFFTLQITGFGM
jgi:hypothetical protein